MSAVEKGDRNEAATREGKAQEQSHHHTGGYAPTKCHVRCTQERIAKRAYELYLERGCREGCALEDWVDAEREILTLPRG